MTLFLRLRGQGRRSRIEEERRKRKEEKKRKKEIRGKKEEEGEKEEEEEYGRFISSMCCAFAMAFVKSILSYFLADKSKKHNIVR